MTAGSTWPGPRVLALAARPKTLWAAAAPVVVGTAMAAADGVMHTLSAMLALAGALLIQVATNFHNDYADFEKGTDDAGRTGPIRVTAAGLATPAMMRRATVAAFALAVAAGGYLMVRGGWPIVAVGAASILFGVLYTAGRWSLAYLGVADLFVLVFFGPVAVGGTYYVQALALPPVVLLAGLAPGFLATAILMVNNIRDVEGDAASGKRTLVVRVGRPAAVRIYALLVVAAAATPVVLWLWTGEHAPSMAAAVVAVPGIGLVRRVADPEDPARLNEVLGQTARLLLLYCLVFSAGWLL